MNGSMIAALVGLALSAAACAAPPAPVDPQSIKPAARFGPVPPPPPSGELRVNTETEEVVIGDDMPHWVHIGYDIFDASGKFVQHVDNHISNTDEGLMTVSLVPGKYLVGIPQGRRPKLWVEVTIVDGRRTEADVTELSKR